MIASYVADIPEAENLLGVKRRHCTPMPWYVCEVKRADLADFSDARKRYWKKIEADLPMKAHMSGAKMNQLEFLDKISELPMDPVFVTLPFVWIHRSVDVYAIIRFQPLHNLSLGVSRLLKECIWNMVGGESRETRAPEMRSGSKTFLKPWKLSYCQHWICFWRIAKNASPYWPSSGLW